MSAYTVGGLTWATADNDPDATYRPGDVVWLKEMDGQPREKCTITVTEGGGMYVGEVEVVDEDDDGIREFHEDMVEGPAKKGH